MYWILYTLLIGCTKKGVGEGGWVDEFHVTGETSPSFLDETVEEVLLVQGMFFA